MTFDRLYARHISEVSKGQWTPIVVALRASRLLAPEVGIRVLDVGAGPGKLCCVGALTTNAFWHGVERDADLFATACVTAIMLRADHRASFTCGDITEVDWTAFDSFYLFNPFEAALFAGGLMVEPTELTARWSRYDDELEHTEGCLADLPTGTRVVTYHGFGGEMPDSYRLASCEPIGSDHLALWIKGPTKRFQICRAAG